MLRDATSARRQQGKPCREKSVIATKAIILHKEKTASHARGRLVKRRGRGISCHPRVCGISCLHSLRPLNVSLCSNVLEQGCCIRCPMPFLSPALRSSRTSNRSLNAIIFMAADPQRKAPAAAFKADPCIHNTLIHYRIQLGRLQALPCPSSTHTPLLRSSSSACCPLNLATPSVHGMGRVWPLSPRAVGTVRRVTAPYRARRHPLLVSLQRGSSYV